MIYATGRLNGKLFKLELTENNTYIKCAKCGKPVRISLDTLAGIDCKNPLTVQVHCPKCSSTESGKEGKE